MRRFTFLSHLILTRIPWCKNFQRRKLSSKVVKYFTHKFRGFIHSSNPSLTEFLLCARLQDYHRERARHRRRSVGYLGFTPRHVIYHHTCSFSQKFQWWKGQGGVPLAKASAVHWFPWVPGPKEGCSIAVITEVQCTPLSPVPVSTKPPCLLLFQMPRLKKF